jgi:hypothetical protein
LLYLGFVTAIITYLCCQGGQTLYKPTDTGGEVAIVMAVTLILGYMAWIVMREIYVRLAIWAEEHDEGVHLLFVKCLAGAILFNMP